MNFVNLQQGRRYQIGFWLENEFIVLSAAELLKHAILIANYLDDACEFEIQIKHAHFVSGMTYEIPDVKRRQHSPKPFPPYLFVRGKNQGFPSNDFLSLLRRGN